MNVMLYLGILWILYGVAGLLGWQRINKKYKGYDWTRDYIRRQGLSWLMLGIPTVIFDRLFVAGYNTVPMFIFLLVCLSPSLIYTIVVEKRYGAKLEETRDAPG